MRVSSAQTASWNALPLGASGTVNSLSSPAKYAASCSSTSGNEPGAAWAGRRGSTGSPGLSMYSPVRTSPSPISSRVPIGESTVSYTQVPGTGTNGLLMGYSFLFGEGPQMVYGVGAPRAPGFRQLGGGGGGCLAVGGYRAQPGQRVQHADVAGQERVRVGQRPHPDVGGGPRADAAQRQQLGAGPFPVGSGTERQVAARQCPRQPGQREAAGGRHRERGRIGGG